VGVAKILSLGVLAAGLVACATAPGVPPSAEDLAARWGPIIPGAHFHHVHLNVKDRDASIAFYTKHFDAKRAKFAGQGDAIWAQRSWLLFNEVTEAPQPQTGTALGHFGWGAPDAPAEFQRQKSLGANFQTELRDISSGLGGKAGQFYFMYVRGPDGELIEINTDPDNNFGHIHMSSADAIATGAWYRNMFGLEPAPPYFDDLVVQTGSGQTSRQFFDNVNMIINGRENATFRSTRGSVTDHIGISVPDLDAALAAVRSHRIAVLQEAKPGPGNQWRSAFIEGPDKMVIELIEDRSEHPPITD
jgi:catechol 2,3-dioxygenase-like lactoylglutathione lyase family enzyme